MLFTVLYQVLLTQESQPVLIQRTNLVLFLTLSHTSRLLLRPWPIHLLCLPLLVHHMEPHQRQRRLIRLVLNRLIPLSTGYPHVYVSFLCRCCFQWWWSCVNERNISYHKITYKTSDNPQKWITLIRWKLQMLSMVNPVTLQWKLIINEAVWHLLTWYFKRY